jgi:phenylpropionate dioxygenase-like ring-hydroxylating dioxygenase large terminal subunit
MSIDTFWHHRYDILAENLIDLSHVPYAHKGVDRQPRIAEVPERYVLILSFIFVNANYQCNR